MGPGAVDVVLVHWNQPERCDEAVAAWEAQTIPVRVTVVDNASGSAARGRLAELVGSRAEIVDAGGNLGFGPGANVGLRLFLADDEGPEWVAVAPHDALPEPDCVETMLSVLADRPRTGLACADVGDDHRPVVDPYFGAMVVAVGSPEGASAWGAKAAADREVAPRWEPVGYPHGTLLLARRQLLEEVGVFDEAYFAYCEEADLGERARRAGWDVALVRGAEVRNPYLGGDAATVDYLMLRNTLRFVRTHFGRYRATIRFLIAVGDLVTGVVSPGTRPWIFVPRARVRALVDAVRGRAGPPPSGLVGSA